MLTWLNCLKTCLVAQHGFDPAQNCAQNGFLSSTTSPVNITPTCLRSLYQPTMSVSLLEPAGTCHLFESVALISEPCWLPAQQHQQKGLLGALRPLALDGDHAPEGIFVQNIAIGGQAARMESRLARRYSRESESTTCSSLKRLIGDLLENESTDGTCPSSSVRQSVSIQRSGHFDGA